MTSRPGNFDRNDRRILALLARNARSTVSEIARQTGLSAPTASERIARLRDTGVIRRFTTEIDEQKAGSPVCAIVEFKPRGSSTEAAFDHVSSLAEVRSAYVVTGSSLLVLIVRVATNDALNVFLAKLNRLGETRTNIVLSTLFEGRGPFEQSE